MNLQRKWGYAIAIHGGAGNFTNLTDAAEKQAYLDGLKEALEAGQKILSSGGKSLDAVQAAVRCMEDNTMFNCGKGSVFNHAGSHELDAAIMDGSTLNCGAAAGVKTVKNPILLARAVMENTEHVLLSGDGADKFAAEMNLEIVTQEYFYNEKRYKQWQEALNANKMQLDHCYEKKMGTVGAVAYDSNGNIAAATSTGGITNKRYGRVGDSPLIGAGTYANNESCAVSCTGKGEFFIRILAAHEIHALMKYKGYDLSKAVDEVLFKQLPAGSGGLIAVDNKGNMELKFNTNGMLRGMANDKGLFETAIF